MDWVALLKSYYQNTKYDDLSDNDLLNEAIETLESYFETMSLDELTTRSRPLAISYLALKHEKDGAENETSKQK